MNLAFLGMDASKGYLDCSLLDFEKQPILKPFKIYDNKAGHLQLQETLNKSLLSVDMIYAGIESTGGYENNWYNSLLTWSSKVKMIRINPIRIHHESKKSKK